MSFGVFNLCLFDGSLIVGPDNDRRARPCVPNDAIFVTYGRFDTDQVLASDGKDEQEVRAEIVVVWLNRLDHAICWILLYLLCRTHQNHTPNRSAI